jgi:hypothetical protein
MHVRTEGNELAAQERKASEEDKVRSCEAPDDEERPVHDGAYRTEIKTGIRDLREVHAREWWRFTAR